MPFLANYLDRSTFAIDTNNTFSLRLIFDRRRLVQISSSSYLSVFKK